MTKFLVEDWRDAWKWLSVQISSLLIVWASIPEKQQDAVLGLLGLDQSKLMGIVGVAIILGRLIQQQQARVPPPKVPVE
jgi:hypothetical protein